MHELSITENILEIVLRHAKDVGVVRVTDLFIVIGELSSIVDDSVQFYWDFVAEGTAAEGAQLHFRRIPAEFACRECGRHYPLSDSLLCPGCGSSRLEIITGREFFLEAIEVSDPDKDPAMTGKEPSQSDEKA